MSPYATSCIHKPFNPGEGHHPSQDTVTTAATAPGTSFFKCQAEKGRWFSMLSGFLMLSEKQQGRIFFSCYSRAGHRFFLKTQLQPVGILLDFENTRTLITLS